MNFADIVVIFSVTALVATAVLIIYKSRKTGKRSCGGDCSHCGGCGKEDKS
ncbi:MAG: FeoB-associated Cys-rich membrane protein [Oscillospiraceae bacterium]|nr:FeoB-associated Cys-rich membrane protein [Oscillospiraceae bacterium]